MTGRTMGNSGWGWNDGAAISRKRTSDQGEPSGAVTAARLHCLRPCDRDMHADLPEFS